MDVPSDSDSPTFARARRRPSSRSAPRAHVSQGQASAFSLGDVAPPQSPRGSTVTSIIACSTPLSSVSTSTARASMTSLVVRASRPLSSISATPGSKSLQRPRHAASPVLNAESAYKIGYDGNRSNVSATKPQSQAQASDMRAAVYSNQLDPTSDEMLSTHMFAQGFLSGKYSDIKIHAFGESYRLHRIVLDRAPYFASLLSGAWAEEGATELTLSPEDMDRHITQRAFEHVMRGLYGDSKDLHDYQAVMEILPVASWLGLANLLESSVCYLLDNMDTSRIHQIVQIAADNYYGTAGERLLCAARAMLFRQGWEMPYDHWNNIPAELVKEIIGGDAFYVPGEWERWFLATKILNRRLREVAILNELIDDEGMYLVPLRKRWYSSAIRPGIASTHAFINSPWIQLYLDPEIVPIYELLDSGIQYTHIKFERLHQVRGTRDIFGTPILPYEITSDALWMAEELRLKIESAATNQVSLGLEVEDDEEAEFDYDNTSDPGVNETNKCKVYDSAPNSPSQVPISDLFRLPARFRIPAADISCIYGQHSITADIPETTLAGGECASPEWSSHDSNVYASNVKGGISELRQSTKSGYTHFPPFRFSIEFPNPRALREKKRIYSHTIWYAGSLWNLYIQRAITTNRSQQLGVYLHRVKDKDHATQFADQFLAFPSTYRVDDRIGQLERDLNRLPDLNQHQFATTDVEADVLDRTINSPLGGKRTSTITPTGSPTCSSGTHGAVHGSECSRVEADSDSETPPQSLVRHRRLGGRSPFHVASRNPVCPYTDARPTIKTYFKIYSPTKNGQQISMYESAPDNFELSKSWGWRSSSMVLDETSSSASSRNDGGKLRFMVVLGNI